MRALGLALVAAAAGPAGPLVEANVTAVWTDIESHSTIVGGYLRNATSLAHGAGLRLAVDAQVGWAFESNGDPSRPVHEQVMDIVDEITLMDYFTSCRNDSLSRDAEGLAGRCDPMQAAYLAAPFLSYASFLQTARNRTVLLDIGIAMTPDGKDGRVSTELDLEIFLQRTWSFLHSQKGATNADEPWSTATLHTFAIFKGSSYQQIAAAQPCPSANPICATPASSRPPRAIWWYNLLGLKGRAGKKPTPTPLNQTAIAQIISWCRARHVTELYIDQYVVQTNGSALPPALERALQVSFEAFVVQADAAGIDIQLYVGEDAGDDVPERVAKVARWCNRSRLCGQRISRTPHWRSLGKGLTTRSEAAAKCSADHMQLCRKEELVGHPKCEAGWASDFEGYWNAKSSKGCGAAGFHSWSGKGAGAWCCHATSAISLKHDDDDTSGSADVVCRNQTDCTDELQQALDDASSSRVSVKHAEGRQWITRPLTLKRSNVTITIESGVVLQARRGFFHGPHDTLLTVEGTSNVSLQGPGSIRMWRQDYANLTLYSKAEWRAGLQLINNFNLTVKHLTIANTGGDGVYVHGLTGSRLHNITTNGAYRNGLSVISAENLLIDHVSAQATALLLVVCGSILQIACDFWVFF